MAPMIGMKMSPTSESTMRPKAAPMITPMARSTTLPFRANFLNSSSMDFLLYGPLDRTIRPLSLEQEIACQLVEVLDGLEPRTKAIAVAAGKALDYDRIGRRKPMFDVLELLIENQIEKRALRLDQGIEIAIGPDAQRPDTGKPRRSRALDDVMTDGEHARQRDDAEQPSLFQVDAAALGADTAEQIEARFGLAGCFRQQLGKADLAVRQGEAFSPQRGGKAEIAVDGAKIEKDIDRHQVTGVRAPDPIGDALSPRRGRAAPLRIFRHDAAAAIGHADLMQDVGDMDRESREPAVRVAVRFALGENQRVVLIEGKQAFAAPGRAENREGIGTGCSTASLAH